MTLTDPWASPPEAPSTPRTGRWTPGALAIGALALLVFLTGSTVAAIEAAGRGSDPRLEALQRDVDARVPALSAFVERERGLQFARPVDVELLADEDFEEALLGGGGDHEELDAGAADVGATLAALGLLGPDDDLDALTAQSYEDVVGFYDSADERLVVRGDEVDAYVELVIVHELTHALQDQVFDLDRPALSETDGEQAAAFTALVEGDATRVETAWLLAQTPQVQAEVAAEEDRRFGDRADDEVTVVDLLFGFPYYAGEPYVEQVLERGGQPALDEAFRNPPTSSEQVLHPGASAPVVPPGPDARGERVDQGVLGEQGLALLLGVDPTEDGPQVGWGGDRYVTVEVGDGFCTSATIVMDTPRDRDELIAALPDAGYPDVRPVGARDVALRSCSS